MEKIEEGGDSGFLDLVALDSRIRHTREGMLRRRRTAAVSCGRMQPGDRGGDKEATGRQWVRRATLVLHELSARGKVGFFFGE